jgi:hypothetical protein
MKINTKNLLPTAFILLSCFLCLATNAQSKETTIKKVYGQIGIGAASKNGVIADLGIQAILKKNWTATVSYQSIEMDPKNLPADYEQGYTVIFIIPIYDEYPAVKMNLISFTAGKYFETGRKTWFTTEAGISIGTGDKMSFTPQPAIHDIWYATSNYSVTKENTTTLGAVLKADFNWAFLPYVGLGAGVFANFNSVQSPVGFQVKLLFGWMNTKRKH